jgi:hypothetical protein
MADFQLDTSGERWLAVVGYEGAYEVSNLGRVRSIARTIQRAGAYGDDWPRWQRRLYPFTYERDAADVERRLADLRQEVARARVLLWRCIKARATDPSVRHLLAHQRLTVDRGARYIRNGMTQLRLIEASRLRLAA